MTNASILVGLVSSLVASTTPAPTAALSPATPRAASRLILERGRIDLVEVSDHPADGSIRMNTKDDTGIYSPDSVTRDPDRVSLQIDRGSIAHGHPWPRTRCGVEPGAAPAARPVPSARPGTATARPAGPVRVAELGPGRHGVDGGRGRPEVGPAVPGRHKA